MFYTYEYTQYIFSMKYSAHYIIYTALSTLYLRALHPDRMFGIKQLNNNKDMDVPLVCFDYSSDFMCKGRRKTPMQEALFKQTGAVQ